MSYISSYSLYRGSFVSAIALGALCVSPTSHAQTNSAVVPAEDAANAMVQGDIVVTARKNAEDILKTPIAIKALTSEDLTARGIVSLQDVAAFTPGLKIVNNAAGRNDRSFQQIIIRGFVPSNASFQTTSVFIDGLPVASATAISNITDPERIEILKGPQSAYFGRQTFAGAFNVVTKLPTETLSGSLSALAGTRANYDVEAMLSGPLMGETLGFRATIRGYGKDGSYKNAGVPNQTLGDQSTRTGTLALVFKPAYNFTAKAFGMLTTNDDGPSAQGVIPAYTLANGSRTILQGQSNCTFTGRDPSTNAQVQVPYFCGVAPALINAPSANTTEDAFIKNFLASPRNRTVNPEDGANGYGLRSRYYHLHLVMDWEIPDTGITLSSLTGYNNEHYSELADLDNYYDTTTPNGAGSIAAGGRSYFDFPFLVERENYDFSQEFRASFDNNGPFRLQVGGSYLNATVKSSLGGGNGGLGIGTFLTPNGATRSKTMGVFFGLGYDIAPGLTINVDGRYQIDHLFAYATPLGVTLTSDVFAPAGFYPGGALLSDGKFKNFMPRVIVNYDVTPETMVYASFSQGVNPGAFNTSFLTGSAAIARTAQSLGYGIETRPEKLDNYEVGIKGRLFDRRVRYSISAYYALWRDQLTVQPLNGLDPDTGLPLSLQATTNSGRVRLKGIEADVSANLTPELTVDLSGAINDSYIVSFVQPTLTQLTGMTDFRGKENPLTSKYSATASAQYTKILSEATDLKVYGRVDFTYKSGIYSNAANIVRTPDMNQVNLRIGGGTKEFSLEGFVTNVFNNRAYSNIADGSLINSTFSYSTYNSALVVGLRELRTFGVRAKYSF